MSWWAEGCQGKVRTLGKQLDRPWHQVVSREDGGEEVKEKGRKRETVHSERGATSNHQVATGDNQLLLLGVSLLQALAGWRKGGRLSRGTTGGCALARPICPPKPSGHQSKNSHIIHFTLGYLRTEQISS